LIVPSLDQEMPMNAPYLRAATLACFTFVLSACAGHPRLSAPEVPAQLRAPAGQVLFLEALGSGVQVYECAAAGGRYQWTFRNAELDLTDGEGRTVGRHYYPGPTWEAADGSKVVTEVKSRVPAPDASAVPWLLATRKSGSGTGLFADLASIQRVATAGGVAPQDGCAEAQVGKFARVPYTARFFLYRTGPSASARDPVYATAACSFATAAIGRGMAAIEAGAAADARAAFVEAAASEPGCALAHWGVAAANLAGLPSPLRADRLAEGAAAAFRAKAIGGTTERECELIDAVAQFYYLNGERTHDMRLVHFERALSRSRRAHPDDAIIAKWHERASRAAYARAVERAEAAYYRVAQP
jgi:Protein of unknown function (DUF3455)